MAIPAIVEKAPESGDRRADIRWRIKIEVPNLLSDERSHVVIHDISTAGMLIETRSSLEIGQQVLISLPEAGKVVAHVVWQDEPVFGCRFDQPLPQAAVSAIRLRSPSHESAPRTEAPKGLPGRLIRLRRAKGLSRAEMSEQMGISKATIWAWETGRSTPRHANLIMLAELFGLTVQQLHSRESDDQPPVKAPAHREFHAERLKQVIEQSKTQVAEAAGMCRSRIHIYIEF